MVTRKPKRVTRRWFFHFRLLPVLFFCCSSFLPLIAQKNALTGIVIDEDGKPLSAATIVSTTTHVSTITDTTGRFALNNIGAGNNKLEISALGFKIKVVNFNTDTISDPLVVHLEAERELIDEVSVSGTTSFSSPALTSLSVQLIKEEMLKESRSNTLMQTLSRIPGISSMDVGSGISKPVIRGLSYYRVAIAENGIKQEGQQWSSHHGISIDQHAVSHVEIIKGPATLQYGSGAIGGVINVLPHHVPLNQDVLEGEINLQGKTNTGWIGGAANLSYRKGSIYAGLNISHQRFGDFHIPETDSFLLPAPVSAEEASHHVQMGNSVVNTAGRETGISGVLGLVKSNMHSYLAYQYVDSRMGFFDWQGLQSDSMREAHDESLYDLLQPRQEVVHYSLNSFTNLYFGENKLELSMGFQQNHSAEYAWLLDRTGNRADDKTYFESLGNLDLDLTLATWSAHLNYSINTLENQKIRMGISSQQQYHITGGYGHILPVYQRFAAGGYLIYSNRLSRKWTLNTGVRVDYYKLLIEKTINPDPAYGDPVLNPEIDRSFPGFSFSVGCAFKPVSGSELRLNLGRSYRIPSVYELAAYGLHRHEGRFEKGNPDNNEETAWQFDLGYEQKWGSFAISISPFLNYFTNYLYLNPTSELRPEGQVYEYLQSTAMLAGSEATVKLEITKHLTLNSGLEYVYAVNTNLQKALPQTPPLNILTALDYTFKKTPRFSKARIGLEWKCVAAQEYTVPNELSTPGYNSFNLNLKSDFRLGGQTWTVWLSVRNIFNTKFYNHISFYRRLRIPEPGRDFQLSLSIPIHSNNKPF